MARRGYRFIGELLRAEPVLEANPEKRTESQPSVAVLPFANVSREGDEEYFSDGLTEEIINALTQVAGIKVIARTSAFAFKGKNEDIRKIAEALGVTNVLEGSVRRAGNRLRVTAELIHAADGTHLWSHRYDRELTDVFTVQDEIAAAITGALQVTLTGRPIAAPSHEPIYPPTRRSSGAGTNLTNSRQRRLRAPKTTSSRRSGWTRSGPALILSWASNISVSGSLVRGL